MSADAPDTASTFARERAWFHRLLDASPDERAALLEQLRSESTALHQRVLRLLAKLGDGQDAEPATAEPGGTLPPGSVIAGRYRIEGLLGVGGMGEVHAALRLDDTRQPVAIKRVRGDLLGNAARFMRERRILARLQHPNIAHLIDAGVTDAGTPWFALERIEGTSITRWCDARNLGLRSRVRLFTKVCDAVQYAHRNLVLHRDLKPGNILVTDDGEPKLLDFGIAKLLDDSSDAASQTRTVAFTPAYASPEQLRGETLTTLSDVYQLGLILSELCSGLPARTGTASSQGGTQTPAARALRACDPTTADRLASARSTVRTRLIQQLQGDLGRIIGKALADDPAERYATATELSDDLRRWLSDEPVRAQRASTGYRLRKFLRRNRVAAAAAGVALVALVVGTAGVLWQSRQARLHAEQALHTRQFLLDLFNAADPDANAGAQVTVRDVLDRGAIQLEQGTLDAVLRAEFSGVLADLYRRLGEYPQGEALARAGLAQLEASGAPALAQTSARLGLARLLIDSRQADEADALLTALETDAPRDLPPALQPTLTSLRAQWHALDGDLQAAADTQRRVLAQLAPDGDPLEQARARLALASTLTELEQFNDAAPLLESAIATLRAQHGEIHSDVAKALEQLSALRFYQGDPDAALVPTEQALSIQTRLFGAQHPRTLMNAVQRAAVLRNTGRMDEAQASLDSVLEQLGQDRSGAGLARRAEALVQRGLTRMRRGLAAEAETDLDAAITLYERDGVRDPLNHATAYLTLANLRVAAGRRADATPLLARARELVESSQGLDAVRTRLILSQAAVAERPDPKALEVTVREALQTATAQLGPDHPTVSQLNISLGSVLIAQERMDEARDTLDAAIAQLDARPAPSQNHADVVYANGIRLRIQTALKTGETPPAHLLERLPASVDTIVASPMMPPRIKVDSALALAQAHRYGIAPAIARAALETARTQLKAMPVEEAAPLRAEITELAERLR